VGTSEKKTDPSEPRRLGGEKFVGRKYLIKLCTNSSLCANTEVQARGRGVGSGTGSRARKRNRSEKSSPKRPLVKEKKVRRPEGGKKGNLCRRGVGSKRHTACCKGKKKKKPQGRRGKKC